MRTNRTNRYASNRRQSPREVKPVPTGKTSTERERAQSSYRRLRAQGRSRGDAPRWMRARPEPAVPECHLLRAPPSDTAGIAPLPHSRSKVGLRQHGELCATPAGSVRRAILPAAEAAGIPSIYPAARSISRYPSLRVPTRRFLASAVCAPQVRESSALHRQDDPSNPRSRIRARGGTESAPRILRVPVQNSG